MQSQVGENWNWRNLVIGYVRLPHPLQSINSCAQHITLAKLLSRSPKSDSFCAYDMPKE